LVVTATPDNFNTPVAGNAVTVMLSSALPSVEEKASAKFADVNVTVVPAEPVTEIAASVGASFTAVTVIVAVPVLLE
jgi:hypothetical protein